MCSISDEVEALRAIYGEKVRWLSSPQKQQYDKPHTSKTPLAGVLQIEVPLSVPKKDEELYRIELYASIDDVAFNEAPVTTQLGVPPLIERTQSGNRWFACVQLTFLPALDLRVVVIDGFVESFSISCVWLDEPRLSSLCTKLDSLRHQNSQMPLLGLWVDWIDNQAAQYLGLESCVVLNWQPNQDCDTRVVNTANHMLELAGALLRFDVEQEAIRFDESTNTCPICFDEFLGSQMQRQVQCLHAFCTNCLQEYVQDSIKQGLRTGVKCLIGGCDSFLSVNEIRSVICDSLFVKWEELTLNRALESMQDVCWCPRCSNPVVLDSNDQSMGFCVVCNFNFCLRCNEQLHPGEKCASLESKLSAIANEERHEDKEQGGSKLLLMKQEALSLIELNTNTTPCPHCFIPTVKIEGCNKMTCSNCNRPFCYECGKAILGYDHFSDSGKCNLHELVRWTPNPTMFGDPKPPNEKLLMQVALQQ